MSIDGAKAITDLEKQTRIQRLFHESEELKRQYRAAPNGLNAAKIMGEALRLDEEIRNLVDQKIEFDSNGETHLKTIAKAMETDRAARHGDEEQKTQEKPKEALLHRMAEHADMHHVAEVAGRVVNVAAGLLKPLAHHEEEPVVKKEPPPFDGWIIRHLDQRRKVEAGQGEDYDTDPNCSFGRWIQRHREDSDLVTAVEEKHRAFHDAVKAYIEGKRDTTLARASAALMIELHRIKGSWEQPDTP